MVDIHYDNMRDYRFDVGRALCMPFVVLLVHLCAYIYPEVRSLIYVHPVLYIFSYSCLGVFPLLFGCEHVANRAFPHNSSDEVSPIGSLIKNVSYASMACYLFHRLFFWAGEMIWNPSADCLKWVYMSGVVFPIMLVLSFYIQKLYDKLVKNL